MSPKQSERLALHWTTESLALAKPFKISRGSKTHADLVVLNIYIGDKSGWAEAVPYARYNETIASTITILENIKPILAGLEAPSSLALLETAQAYINDKLAASSARNLLDCALWDLKAKLCHTNVNDLIAVAQTRELVSAQTLSVDSLELMLANAKTMSHLPLIKIKLDAVDVVEKMQAIHAACPHSLFIIDANEAWSMTTLRDTVDHLAALNVALIEQPLAAGCDSELIGFSSPIPLCADESCHTSADVKELATKYSVLNIKLDKTGGLSEALLLAKTAKAANLQIMLGCMVASSLAMAPIFVLAQYADFVDLDGPVLVAKDRKNGFVFTGSTMRKSANFLWGESR